MIPLANSRFSAFQSSTIYCLALRPVMIRESKFINLFILIALALTWGSSFILMKRGLVAFSSEQVAALRIFIAFLFVSPLLFIHFKKELLKYWKAFLGMGMFGNFIPAFLFTKAETGISSALTGMLNSLTPLFTVIVGILFYQLKTSWLSIWGVVIGFIGAIILLYNGDGAAEGNNILFSLYVVLATVFYAISVNIIKKHLGGINSITATVLAMTFIGPLAGIYLFSTDFVTRLQTNPEALGSLGYVSILGIVGTALSVMIFNVLIRNTNAVFASSVTYLIPIVAIMWGVIDGEPIQWFHFLGVGVILVGVYILNREK